jgi:hypothetical protein
MPSRPNREVQSCKAKVCCHFRSRRTIEELQVLGKNVDFEIM